MRDVNEQIAAYFDATVERITPDDVLAGREVRYPTRQLVVAPQRQLRPAWSIAVAFVTTVFVIGGSLGVGILLRAELLPVGSGFAPAGSVTGAASMAWLWIPAVAVALLLMAAVVVFVGRGRGPKLGTDGGTTMTMTTEQPGVDERSIHRLQTTNRALIIAVIVLAVLAIGFGGWAIYQATTTDEVVPVDDAGAVPDDVAALIDEWWAANERADGSVIELYSPTGYHMYGATRIAREDIAGHLSTAGWTHEWTSEPYLIVDEGDGRYVAVRGVRNSPPGGGESSASAMVFEITTGTDGQLQLAQTAWTFVN